jgi:hypothetical protein
VTGDQSPLQLWNYGVIKTQDPGPDIVAIGQSGQQILADFLLNPPLTMSRGTQLPDGAGQIAR